MINLDEYMAQTEEVIILGETIHIKQPSIFMYEQINDIEKGMNSKNVMEKRVLAAKVVLDNNTEGKIFNVDDLKKLSRAAIEMLFTKIAEARLRAENDPN